MTVITTESGLVAGTEDQGIHAFLSVPYAAPVTAANRFEAPGPVTPWDGIRDATTLGPVCPQLPTYGPVGTNATSALSAGEDFLTLNIRTPAPRAGAGLPVLVWIHGGGYAVGSANEPVVQSGAFAASGVVEVTVNYRLGAMGFLHVPGKPDNRGLLDQIAALAWVRRNIAAFGGDPDRVTYAGRSAGGFSIATVMAMPASHGLYARAMPQSGAATAVSSRADALKLTARVGAALGVAPEAIPGVPLDELLVAQRDLCNESYERHSFDRDGDAAMLGVPFVPVIDGASLPEHPLEAARAGRTAPVPMMIGCTTAEYLTHATAQPEMDFALAARLLHERVRPMGLSGEEILRRYATALPHHGPRGLWRAIAGDLVFQNPATRFARAHGRHQPVWKYLYGPLAEDELGAAHGAEVGAVWYRRGMDLATQPARQRVSDTTHAGLVHDCWVAFIAAPAPLGALIALPGGPDWPRHDLEGAQLLHLDGRRPQVCRDPFDSRTVLWD